MSESQQNQTSQQDNHQERQLAPSHDTRRSSQGVADPAGNRSGSVPAQRSTAGSTLEPTAGSGGTEVATPASGNPPVSGPLAQMHKLIERAGEIPFPDDVVRILSEPIDDSLVDVRPDGFIYVSHPHYRDRLDRAFGPGAWALIPLAVPRVQDNRVLYYGFLKARGQYISDAVGGAQYYPNNSNGSYDNSVEAAKSDCLVRCCKALPMFRECWDNEYEDYWLATYAEQGVTRQSPHKKVWKKAGTAMRDFTMRPDRQHLGEYYRAPRVTDEQNAHVEAIAAEGTLKTFQKDEYNDNAEDYQDGREDY
jgi:hypothetical protein